MTLFLSIVAFIVIFSLLILIHEFGHFFVAKKGGIKVEEFGLGIPPKIWGFKPKNSETTYTLNAIPFGGFVRLYGEDSHDPKALKSNRSFAGKPAWVQILVVIAGVVMNLLLAFVLLTAGLIFGMQPLYTSPEDVYQGINDGVIKLQEGIILKESKGSFEKGDKILAINGEKIEYGDEVANLKEDEMVKFEVERNGKIIRLEGEMKPSEPLFETYDTVAIPLLVVQRLDVESPLWQAGVRSGDIIKKINDRQIFGTGEFEKILVQDNLLKLELLRDGQVAIINVENAEKAKLVISAVDAGSSAEKAQLRVGDEVILIDGQKISGIEDVSKIMTANKNLGQTTYTVSREGKPVEIKMDKGENGRIGVGLSELINLNQGGLSFYIKAFPHSVLEIKEVSYPWYEAPGKALTEMGRLAGVTIQMFGNVLAQAVTRFSVPDGVAGPVGIAQMTYTFVQEGFLSLVRFAALLSLSLGIINILPFPGLDGGRFFLIFISVLIGKKLNPKVEGLIHLAGFLILMLLILLITFNDIVRIFN